jgi:hypothetical protein
MNPITFPWCLGQVLYMKEGREKRENTNGPVADEVNRMRCETKIDTERRD